MADTPRTSVNQAPGGGSLYPFVAEGDLVGYVLDAYVSYEDDARELVMPFRAQINFESLGPLNVICGVYDANDVSVFSAESADTTVIDWNGRKIIEWVFDTVVCRLVVVLPDSTFEASQVLDPRTYDRLPARVKSLTVGVVTMSGDVEFKSGNNVQLSGAATTRTDGSKYVDQVNIDAVPGAGEGRITGCDDGDTQIRRINQVTPDCGGDFKIVVDDCFRPRLPITVTDGYGTYAADGLTAEQAKAAIQLTSDCHPCRDCDYYVRTYRGLKRVWNRWKTVAGVAETTRDTFAANRDRWQDSKECRDANRTRMVLRSLNNCKISAGGSLCNSTDDCWRNVELRFTVDPLATYTEAFLEASTTDGEEPYAPLVDYNVFRFFIDYMEPHSVAVAKIRLCIPNCSGTAQVTFEAFVEDQPVADPIVKNAALVSAPASFNCCG